MGASSANSNRLSYKKMMWPLHRAGATLKGKRRLVVTKIVNSADERRAVSV